MSTHQEIYKIHIKSKMSESSVPLDIAQAQCPEKKKILNPPEETVPKSHQKQQRSKNAEARVHIQS